MRYMLNLLPIMPLIILFSLTIYIVFNNMNRREIQKIGRLKALAEFTLIGWFVTFIYVTQIMSFGQGAGEAYNLKPMVPFIIALQHGSENAAILPQILLNVMMFVPLGFLLPIVFPKKFKSYWTVLLVSLLLTTGTEIIQFLTRRSPDIDDVIANTMGGCVGFGIYALGCRILAIRKKSTYLSNNPVRNLKLKAAVGIALIFICVVPYGVVDVVNAGNYYGYVYYDHIRPNQIELLCNLEPTEDSRLIYKLTSKSSTDELMERISSMIDSEGTFERDEAGTFVYRHSGSEQASIDSFNRWQVSYDLKDILAQHIGKPLSKQELSTRVIEELEACGVTEVTLKETEELIAGTHYRLTYMDNSQNTDIICQGVVEVHVTGSGKIISISDNRIYGEAHAEAFANTIEDSIKTAMKVGMGSRETTAFIENIEASYYFNENTGFFIPTWNLQGYLQTVDGMEPWNANMMAMK